MSRSNHREMTVECLDLGLRKSPNCPNTYFEVPVNTQDARYEIRGHTNIAAITSSQNSIARRGLFDIDTYSYTSWTIDTPGQVPGDHS